MRRRAIKLPLDTGPHAAENSVNHEDDMSDKPSLKVLLCAPRGFCAGVVRAINTVEHALRQFGAPVYVRHEIVHNRYVVESLKTKGAVFVKELDEVPDGRQPVVFSAHGVPKDVPAEAERRSLLAIDATCPLVKKVHLEAELHHRRNLKIILVGHKGHPEVVGTMGQLPEGSVVLVESAEDVAALPFSQSDALAYVTQTTLSIDDMSAVVSALQARYPQIVGPHRQDICYATTNRQEAVKAIAAKVDAFVAVGSPNSSNSQRLKEVAERNGCPSSQLVLRAQDIDWSKLENIRTLGVTAGASAPEVLVEEILGAFAEKYDLDIETVTTATEDVSFPLPRQLREEVA
jgi:4-hydroxy-3-methylbut-2-enyl diphosphate reductase